MAGVRFSYSGAPVTKALTTTLLQILAAANHRVRVERIRVSGGQNRATVTDVPVLVQILLQTSAGTGTVANLRKLDEDATEALQATGIDLYTVEPTDGGIVLASQLVDPRSHYDFVFPPLRELYLTGGSRLGIRIVNPAQSSVFALSGELEE